MSQRSRAIKLKNGSSSAGSSSDSDSEDNNDYFGARKYFRSNLEQALDRFQTQDRLDRSLLQGILIKSKKKKMKQEPSQISLKMT